MQHSELSGQSAHTEWLGNYSRDDAQPKLPTDSPRAGTVFMMRYETLAAHLPRNVFCISLTQAWGSKFQGTSYFTGLDVTSESILTINELLQEGKMI